jgi:DNA-binding transcriptional LysR family regulator
MGSDRPAAMEPAHELLGIDLRLLESFVVLGEELHFTRAAERLHIAQPALSQQIGRLERQLGGRLFTRPPQAVALTPAGQALWSEVVAALARIRRGIGAARDVAAGDAGTLRLGHLSSYAPHVVPAIAAALRVVAPGVVLEMREGSIEEQLGAVRARALDVALFHLDRDVSIADEALDLIAVATTPRYVVLPPDHALAARRTVRMDELVAETWIAPIGSGTGSIQTASFVASCRRHGFVPQVGQQANSIETMLGLVRSGFGISPAPWAVALRPPAHLTMVEVEDDRHDVVVARLPDTGAGLPASDTFVRTAREVIASLLQGPAG